MKEWVAAYWESARATKGIQVPGLNEPTTLEVAQELDDLLRAGRVSQKMHLLKMLSGVLLERLKNPQVAGFERKEP